jgi:uncharacterized coiled-coil DUF342 family protein
MSLFAVGWNNYTELRASFAERLHLINHNYIEPINSINEQIQKYEEQIKELTSSRDNLISERNQLRSDLWLSYKKTYQLREKQEVIQ